MSKIPEDTRTNPRQDLTVVIPAFNESASLSANLASWIRHAEDQEWILVVVDDGSTDGTQTVLAPFLSSPWLRALRHPINRGYGASLKTGIQEAGTAYIGTMDADGQHSIEQFHELLDALTSSGADMVIGSRLLSDTHGRYRLLGKSLIRRLTRILFDIEIQDLNSGLRVYRAPVIKRLLPYCPDSMAFSDISVLLHLNTKAQVVEEPVTVDARASGQSTINTMTAIETVVEILNIVMWFRPLRLLLPIAAVVMAAGAVWSLPFLLAGRGLSGVALLLLLGGFQVGVLALLAEQFASIRRLELPGVGYKEITSEKVKEE